MDALSEWREITSKANTIYIFGTGQVARRLTELLRYVSQDGKLVGYIVTSRDNNPNELYGKPVFSMDNELNKDAEVFVSLSEVYHPDVFDALRKKNFVSIVPAHKFYNLDISKNPSEIGDCKDYIDTGISVSEELASVRKVIINTFDRYFHAFGKGRLYQSSPSLGLKGIRDTGLRIKKYRLNEILNNKMNVLDIGCNVGFLDIELSPFSNTITGIEYSDSLVEIGQYAVNQLGLDNIHLICDDYNSWQERNEEKYDLIFSFAVHGWLNIDPHTYAKQLCRMLNPKGLIIFESQQLSSDSLYETFISALLEEDVTIVNRDRIIDDGETEREFVLLMNDKDNDRRQ